MAQLYSMKNLCFVGSKLTYQIIIVRLHLFSKGKSNPPSISKKDLASLLTHFKLKDIHIICLFKFRSVGFLSKYTLYLIKACMAFCGHLGK